MSWYIRKKVIKEVLEGCKEEKNLVEIFKITVKHGISRKRSFAIVEDLVFAGLMEKIVDGNKPFKFKTKEKSLIEKVKEAIK